ncbi:MAG: NUDIX domain-containing protein [Candidatus Uhrbacteria bacterium]|nr:NUDIX domain-containing protein [Candidatus Uhrbacteria bacterium]
MRRIKREIVAAMIFSKDGKLFQGKKDPAKGGVYADAWHIPGGGIEEGEDAMTALTREIQEETGIDISPYRAELIDDIGRGESEKTLKSGERVICEMVFDVYKVVIDDKNADEIGVMLGDDLVEYVWRDVADLKGTSLTPPSQELFTRLGYFK